MLAAAGSQPGWPGRHDADWTYRDEALTGGKLVLGRHAAGDRSPAGRASLATRGWLVLVQEPVSRMNSVQ